MKISKKIYNIYAKENCIYESLNEEEFKMTWDMIDKLLSIIPSSIDKKDLRYEESFIETE